MESLVWTVRHTLKVYLPCEKCLSWRLSSLWEQNIAYWTAPLSVQAWLETSASVKNSLDWRLPPLTRWLSLSFLRMLSYFCCFWICRSYLPKCSVLPSKGTNILAVRTTNSVLYLLMTLIINALPMIGIIFVVRWITLLLELEIINVPFKIWEWQDVRLLAEALMTLRCVAEVNAR